MPIIFRLSDRETGQLVGGGVNFLLLFEMQKAVLLRLVDRIRDAKSKIGHFLVQNCFEHINFQSNSLGLGKMPRL
jgi:hypothetical protein